MLPLLALIPAGISIAVATASAVLKKNVEQRIAEGIVEGTNDFEKKLKDRIFDYCKCSGINWVRNLTIIFSSYIFSTAFHLNKDILIACSVIFIIGLYCFQWYSDVRDFLLYYKFYIKSNGFSLDSLNILSIFLKFIYQKAYKEAYDEVKKRMKENVNGNPIKSFFVRLFGQEEKEITETVVVEGFKNQIHYIAGKLTLMVLGFCLYLFIYGSLFRFVVNINFSSWYEPFIWSFQTLYNAI